MKDGNSFISCREAAAILGYTQRHILNLIKKGKLSAHRDESGQFFIDKSEFYRVYPKKLVIEESRSSANSSDENIRKSLEDRIKHLEEIIIEKNNLIAVLKGYVSESAGEKARMLEVINNHTRLLENKSNQQKSWLGIFKRNK
jgi:excisionase family DNA binding protein